MGSPREAVYDVLLAKQQRSLDLAVRRELPADLPDVWARYEQQNAAADAAYQQQARWRR